MNEKTYVKLSLMILCVISLFSFAWAQDGVLSFETDSTTVNVGDTFEVRVILNTGTHNVGVIQVRANFDDTKFSITSGDITINSAVWTLPSPEPPNVTGTLFKFTAGIAGLGVNGTDVLVATCNFTCTAAGDGDITFVGGTDPINSTMALDSTTFTDVLGTLNDITITQGEAQGFDFDTDTQGWQWSGEVLPYSEPTGAHNTVDGTLDITSTNNSDNFGFWYSPIDAIPELTADNLYRLRFGVKSDQVDPGVVPSFRVRFNASNFKQGDFVMVNSNDAGDASPSTTVVDYDLYMRPQADALLPSITGLLSFDMINLNPNDASIATLSLDYVQIDKKAVADLGTSTTVQSYNFDASEDGWASSPAIAPYDQPLLSWNDIEGFIQMECNNNNNTYGFWENTQTQISLNNTVLYQLKVTAGTDANLVAKVLQEDPPLMRIRMYDHPSNQMIRLYQAPVWTDFEQPPAAKLGAISFSDTYVYFVNNLGVGPYLGLAVDIVNFDVNESPTGIVAVTEVELLSFPIPSF